MGNNNTTSNNAKKIEKNDHKEQAQISSGSEASDSYYSLYDKDDSRYLHSESTEEYEKTKPDVCKPDVRNAPISCSILSTESYYSIDNAISMDLPEEKCQTADELRILDVVGRPTLSPTIEANMESHCSINNSKGSKSSLSASQEIVVNHLEVTNEGSNKLERETQEIFPQSPVIRSQSYRDNPFKNWTLSQENLQLESCKSLQPEQFGMKDSNICNIVSIIQEEMMCTQPDATYVSSAFENDESPIITSQSQRVCLSPVVSSQRYKNNPLKNRTIDRSQWLDENLSLILNTEYNVSDWTHIIEDQNERADNIFNQDADGNDNISINQNAEPMSLNETNDEDANSQKSFVFVTNDYLKSMQDLDGTHHNQEKSMNMICIDLTQEDNIQPQEILPQSSMQTQPQSSKAYTRKNNKNNCSRRLQPVTPIEPDTAYCHGNLISQDWIQKRPVTFNCFICESKFRNFKRFKYHIFLHQEPKEECPWCDKKYRLKCHLTKHIQHHHKGMV